MLDCQLEPDDYDGPDHECSNCEELQETIDGLEEEIEKLNAYIDELEEKYEALARVHAGE